MPVESFLPSLLAKVCEASPDIYESIFVSDSKSAIAAVAEGQADEGFVGEESDNSQLLFKPIPNDQLLLVVSPSHTWAEEQFVTALTTSGEGCRPRDATRGRGDAFQRRYSRRDQAECRRYVSSSRAVNEFFDFAAGISKHNES